LSQLPVDDILAGLAIFAAIWAVCEAAYRIACSLLPRLLDRVLRNHHHDLADALLTSTRRWVFPILALSVALQHVPVGPWQHKVAGIVIGFGLLFQLLAYANRLIEFFIRRATFAQGANSLIAANLTALAKLALATIGILFVLDNFGVNVSTFVAGLGVGGIAVALAAQAVLGDAFGSFSISLDRPFDIGDFIVTGDTSGTVDTVGLKTTRIRALSGEMVVIPNSELSRARIQNFKKLVERRVVFKLKLALDTAAADLARVPELIKGVITAMDGTRFDRAHLAAVDDWSFNVEVVWFALTPDYNRYMDIQQAIYLQVLDALRADDILLAIPAQLAVQKSERAARKSASERASAASLS
jgi:small-conductance mechanosensitive channel